MATPTMFSDMDTRARDIFRQIVEAYMHSGEPVGSRTLSKTFGLSPATIRGVMADLEDLGLLRAPHISAGRMPTDLGLRCFLDGILEIGSLTETERAGLEAECAAGGPAIETVLEQASQALPLPKRGACRRAEGGPGHPAYRIRRARPQPRAGRHRSRKRNRRKPHHGPSGGRDA